MLQNTRISLIICDLQEFTRFLLLTTSPGFCRFSGLLRGGSKLLHWQKSTYISVIVRVAGICAIFTTYHVPRIKLVFRDLRGEVVSSDFVKKQHIFLLFCTLEATDDFSLLTTSLFVEKDTWYVSKMASVPGDCLGKASVVLKVHQHFADGV